MQNSTRDVREVSGWSVEIVTSVAELNALKSQWKPLQENSDQTSIFATYEYVSIAWKHFAQPSDRMFILVIKDAEGLVAIAPFKISIITFKKIPARVVEWIARWEGDRPCLLCRGSADDVWRRISYFFRREFLDWDLLQFCEQTSELNLEATFERTARLEAKVDSVGFAIQLNGGFDDYLSQINAKVRSNWKNRSRKIVAMTPSPEVETIAAPESMAAAVHRFISLERTSWKSDAHLGIGKDQLHQDFYIELASELARQGRIKFFFLKQADTDMAASMLYFFGSTVYERHIAHNPVFSNLSPGVYLRTELLKGYFGSKWHEFDLMGMHPSIGRQRHKADWASYTWTGCTYNYFKKFGRLLPIVLRNSIKEQFFGDVSFAKNRTAAIEMFQSKSVESAD